MTLAEARRIVLEKYPLAEGWREFTVSDYVVKAELGGQILGSGFHAKDAWEEAAKAIKNNRIDSGKAPK